MLDANRARDMALTLIAQRNIPRAAHAALRDRLDVMSIDVIDLRDFYSQRLGIVARRLINRGIRARWPNAEGQRVLGIGYPTPYLGLFREDASVASPSCRRPRAC